ncbi:hypothetical protein [Streptomyces sp. NBC_00557]|uniref:hypothetical protein n=1 Tax=Streptomyces sp. NBC_00557 TaxID=2975776 RepID=UPI002E8166F0|nr:hypothetical protein [Streptomyces sp. NBC_00557]WUC36827.1 hypothetical protein OG956_22720 [Streptomyces sp. NBC_00557]
MLDSDERPRRAPILLAAIAVPVVGAAGAHPSSLLRAAERAQGAVLIALMVTVVIMFLIALSLGSIWAVNTVASLIHNIHSGRRMRHGGHP